MNRSILNVLLLAAFLGLFHLSTSQHQADYQGFVRVNWTAQNNSSQTQKLVSDSFSIKDRILELEQRAPIFSQDGHRLLLELKTDSKDSSHRLLEFTEYKIDPYKEWAKYRCQVPKSWIGKAASIQVLSLNNSLDSHEPSILKRVNFYTSPALLMQFSSYFSTFAPQRIIALLLSLALLLWMGKFLSKEQPQWLLGLSYFAIAVLIHFRGDVFFYFDELGVVHRFATLGPGIIFDSHNEHFLPLFFSIYYLETLLFGDCYPLYTLFSIFIHTINSLLLCSLLSRFAGTHDWGHSASRVLSFLYLISSLHAEVLHWAFIIAVMLSQTAVFVVLISGWDFVFSRKTRSAFSCLLASFAAPFLFGNGFMAPIELAMVLFSGALCSTKSKTNEISLRVVFKRSLLLLFGLAILASLSSFLYWLFREGIGHSIDNVRPFADPPAIVRYIFVGTGMGTILRGIGLYPTLAPDSALHLQPLPFGIPMRPLLFFSSVGFLVSLVFLISAYWSKERFKHLGLWLLGLFIIAANLVLPALARWSSGELQSLSLRYHSIAVFGLCIMVLPTFTLIFQKFFQHSSKFKNSSKALLLLLLLHIFFQLHLAATYSCFSEFGVENRDYYAQLADWRKRRRALGQNIDYHANNTELAGLEPIAPRSVSPGLRPDEIYASLHWLNPKRYP